MRHSNSIKLEILEIFEPKLRKLGSKVKLNKYRVMNKKLSHFEHFYVKSDYVLCIESFGEHFKTKLYASTIYIANV